MCVCVYMCVYIYVYGRIIDYHRIATLFLLERVPQRVFVLQSCKTCEAVSMFVEQPFLCLFNSLFLGKMPVLMLNMWGGVSVTVINYVC